MYSYEVYLIVGFDAKTLTVWYPEVAVYSDRTKAEKIAKEMSCGHLICGVVAVREECFPEDERVR